MYKKRKKNTIKSYKQSFETENSWKAGLYTARISNFDVVLCGERMKDGKF